MDGWRRYNGSKAYADRLRNTDEAKEIAANTIPIERETSLEQLTRIPLQATRSTTKPWPR